MTTVIAGIVSALVGVLGVGTGAWLQGRDNRRRWLSDQKLHAAAEFITVTGEIYDHRIHGQDAASPSNVKELWQRAQKSRSALYLLCEDRTVELAEELINGVRYFEPEADGSGNAPVIFVLRKFVQQLRRELGTGKGQAPIADRASVTSESSGPDMSPSDTT